MPEVPSKPALFVDARNALYRVIYAVRRDTRHQIKYHYFVSFLRQIVSWINRFHPDSVHIFWDAPRETVWRRDYLKTYKDRDSSQYVQDISADLAMLTAVAKDFFACMGVRQYSQKRMEADDLLYAATVEIHPKPTIIVSTDSDMTQIPFMFASASVFDPKECQIVPIPVHHPAQQKALMGDKADSIDGYFNIGPKKSAVLLEDMATMEQFLQERGRRTYHLNLLLTDLSLCPFLLKNRVYIRQKMAKPVIFDKAKVNDLVKEHKVMGFLSDWADLVPPFMRLS